MKNNDVVILAAKRSPFGKFGKALKDWSAPQIFSPLVKPMLKEAASVGIVPHVVVDRLIVGNVYSAGEGQHIVRQAARLADLSERCHTHRTERVCNASLQALWDAYLFAREYDELIIAGGMESMSRTPLLIRRDKSQEPVDSMLHDGLCDAYMNGNPHMGQIADEFARNNHIKREAQDEYAFQSYCRAYAAKKIGAARLGIMYGYPIAHDEGIREPNLETMRQLKPVFGETITAGNASQLSDGAAALLVTSYRRAKRIDCKSIARVVAFGDYAGENSLYLSAPIGAVEKVLAVAGLKGKDIDLVEYHEPFAVSPIHFINVHGSRFGGRDVLQKKMNVWGGSIALGHPLGATGGRLVVTLVHALKYYDKRYGLAVACNGGGEAVAVIIENLQR